MLRLVMIALTLAGSAARSATAPMQAITPQSPTVAARSDLTGFWKTDCGDDFGVKIEHAGKHLYSLSFCGPGGCFEPGTWRPNSPIYGDATYRVVSADEIQLPFGSGFDSYRRCPGGQTPAEPTPGESAIPEAPSGLRFKAYYEGLPDLDSVKPFAGHTEAQAAAMLVLTSQPLREPCPPEAEKIPGAAEICGSRSAELRSLLREMAQDLPDGEFSRFWLTTLQGKRAVLVQYDSPPGDSFDRYAAFFAFMWQGER